jgi:hypothetical protein
VAAEQCPDCRGPWFAAAEVDRRGNAGDLHLQAPCEPEGRADEEARAAAHEWLGRLASGLPALPNLLPRSTLTLTLLYGLLALVLITLSVFGYLGPGVAPAIGIVFALAQFTLGPWSLDLSLRCLYQFRWLSSEEVPEHLRDFVARVCADERMRFPSIGPGPGAAVRLRPPAARIGLRPEGRSSTSRPKSPATPTRSASEGCGAGLAGASGWCGTALPPAGTSPLFEPRRRRCPFVSWHFPSGPLPFCA